MDALHQHADLGHNQVTRAPEDESNHQDTNHVRNDICREQGVFEP
jgi:hypothetical protein